MPKRSYFVPKNFDLPEKDREWAKAGFRITDAEVDRQLELMRDHEFRRPYSCWSRVFRNWIRNAEKFGDLKRERRQVREVETPEQRREEADKAWAHMEYLAGQALRK